MTALDLIGNYSVIGSNQNESKITYKGILSLHIDEYERVIAKWLINNEQKQFGIGFFNNNILVINFNYYGDDKTIYKGTVVYKCINNDNLDGFWKEEYGDPKHLGYEKCSRIKNDL